jgi:bacillithiol system protein YtxJ
MSLLDRIGNLLNSEEKEPVINWTQLSEPEELSLLLQKSDERPQVIYKHSTRCGVSAMALSNLHQVSPELAAKADFYFLNVISHRWLSQHVAEQLQVRHESPQLLIIQNGDLVWNGSHYQVSAGVLSEIL